MSYLENLFNVKNKVAVLTGGGGILAGEMARGFLKAGAKTVLLDINEKNLSEKLDSFGELNKNAVGYTCNVLKEDSLKEVYKKILNKFGKIDILINAAGGNMPGATIAENQTIFDLKMADFKKVTDLNLNGSVLPTMIFARAMADQKKGSIINISSMAATQAITRVVGYSVAKAAIDNFTKWMAMEMAYKFGNGIRVNAIAPGFLLTEQNRTLLTNPDGSLTDRGKTVIEMTPFSRFGEPEELVGTILWLSSDASKFVTGAIVPVDGGFSSYSGV
jgi:NAD(P)-dependent dehydrogenase (short-subunit alcohol dehydrogenase family)